MSQKKTLREHRLSLSQNPNAYTQDLERCYTTVVKHLKDAGYSQLTMIRAREEIVSFVDMIFESQECRPFFHIDVTSGLPYCWNAPMNWKYNYIRYEWGHLISRNQNGDLAHSVENLCLQSARCNQHIQSSLNVDELMEYGGKLEQVIKKNQVRREHLFSSDTWKDLLLRLERWR